MRYDHIIGRGFDRWSKGQYTEGQIKAFNDFTNPFILMSGAYRSGKSELGCRAQIRHLWAFKGSKVGIFRAKLASLKVSTLINFLELLHPSWIDQWSNSELKGTLINGNEFIFMGCDFADRLGSLELTGAFIDESAEVTRESLGMIQGRLSGQLELLDKYDNEEIEKYAKSTKDIRQVYLACNPKSDSHYLYKDFIESPKPGHIAYTSNSISNVNLPENYLVTNLSAYVRPGFDHAWIKEQVRLIRQGEKPSDGLHLTNALTPFGQRNLLGLWVALEGAIYQLDDKKHFLKEIPEYFGQLKGYYGAVDWGFQNPRLGIHAHYQRETISGIIDYYAQVDSWEEPQSEPNELIKAIDRLDQVYDFGKIYVPPDQPGLIKTLKKTIGASRVKTAKNNVLAGINTVSRFLNEGKFIILDNGKNNLAWSEMSAYQWKSDRDGTFRDEPLKVADHHNDQIRYLLYTRHHRDAIGSITEDEPIDESWELLVR